MTRRAGRGTDAQVTAARAASGTDPLLVTVHFVAPEFYEPIENTGSKRFAARRHLHTLKLPEILGLPAQGGVAEEMRRIARLITQGKGWIACTPLPDIGDLAFDHRALAMVGDCPPEIARLAVATGAWFSRIGSIWSVRLDCDDRDNAWQLDSDDENMTARCAPVSPSLILEAWVGLRRVMVVHARKDAPPLAYVFEALAVATKARTRA